MGIPPLPGRTSSQLIGGLAVAAVVALVSVVIISMGDDRDDGGGVTEAIRNSTTSVIAGGGEPSTTRPVLDVQPTVSDASAPTTGGSSSSSVPATPSPSSTSPSSSSSSTGSTATASGGAAGDAAATTVGGGPSGTGETVPPVPADRPAAQPGDPNDAYFGGGSPNCAIFPSDNWWNTPITDLPVHPRSAAWVAGIGSGNLHPVFGTIWQGDAIGIPFRIVGADQPRVPVSFRYASESDPGPYPIPADAPIEDGSDRHIVIIDDDNCVLYELFDAARTADGSGWTAGSGAVFDLRSNELRPDRWTSADAAGLPIYPGLVTYEEVVIEGRIDHALRFTAARTQRGYIRPATHWASSITDIDVAPMGARFRLRSEHDCSGYSNEVQVVCAALKTYGMFLADNGSDWHVVGSPDPRWDDSMLRDLRMIPGSAFEVVDTGEPLSR